MRQVRVSAGPTGLIPFPSPFRRFGSPPCEMCSDDPSLTYTFEPGTKPTVA